LRVDYCKRELYEGWRIRELIKKGIDYKDRVPKYIYPFLISILNYKHVILGGTFDHLHKGHKALIDKALAIGKKVTIGIATEKLYKDKFLSETIEPFNVRKKNITDYINYHLNNDRAKMVKIISFSEFTGGVDKQPDIDAIVVSNKTFLNAIKINELRKKNQLKPLMIVIVEDVLAEDGKLISSERIRAGEINRNGDVYRLSSSNYQLLMSEDLRPTLQKPMGKIYKTTKQLLQSIKRLKYPLLISIGDIITDSLLKGGINPDVKVIDHKSRRAKTNLFVKLKPVQKGPSLINKPGTINLKIAEIIKEKIKLALYKKQKSWIVINGEEDLLALPAILFAPLNSLVLYGHWKHGIITVKVSEEIKKKVSIIIKKFN
jgi:cytidyltransferase-like protein